jgi:hypothetical protein
VHGPELAYGLVVLAWPGGENVRSANAHGAVARAPMAQSPHARLSGNTGVDGLPVDWKLWDQQLRHERGTGSTPGNPTGVGAYQDGGASGGWWRQPNMMCSVVVMTVRWAAVMPRRSYSHSGEVVRSGQSI